MTEQISTKEELMERGWYQWYHDDYWVHEDFDKNEVYIDHTYLGFKFEDAIKCENRGRVL